MPPIDEAEGAVGELEGYVDVASDALRIEPNKMPVEFEMHHDVALVELQQQILPAPLDRVDLAPAQYVANACDLPRQGFTPLADSDRVYHAAPRDLAAHNQRPQGSGD